MVRPTRSPRGSGPASSSTGIDVEVKRLEDVHDLRGYDGYVLGSGIYLGTRLKEARRFIDTHAGRARAAPDLAVRERLDRR